MQIGHSVLKSALKPPGASMIIINTQRWVAGVLNGRRGQESAEVTEGAQRRPDRGLIPPLLFSEHHQILLPAELSSVPSNYPPARGRHIRPCHE